MYLLSLSYNSDFLLRGTSFADVEIVTYEQHKYWWLSPESLLGTYVWEQNTLYNSFKIKGI